MAQYQVWFRLNSGYWNNSETANPATNTGGIPISTLVGDVVYPTGQGTGDTIQTFNFGASAFSGTVPSGYSRVGRRQPADGRRSTRPSSSGRPASATAT